MCRLLIIPFLFGVLSPVAANAGDWVYLARSESENMQRKEVGITKKECFKIKREEQKKQKKSTTNFLITNALVQNK